MPRRFARYSLLALCCTFLLLAYSAPGQTYGPLFEGQSDVGSVTPPGTASYDAASQTYTLTSAGANLWGTTDAFHFVWK